MWCEPTDHKMCALEDQTVEWLSFRESPALEKLFESSPGIKWNELKGENL